MRAGLPALLFVVSALLVACQDAETQQPVVGGGARIVTLAPHLAELVVSAGGGSLLVGVSAYSDFPASLKGLPVVSDGFRVDAEALLAVRPSLVLIWGGGGQQNAVELTRRLGLPAAVIETRSIADIARALQEIGRLIGTGEIANEAARQFLDEIGSLGFEGEPLDVFYQIGERPLYTINGDHFISELIARCGGRNVFGALAELAPVVSVEAVVQADPDVILRAGGGAQQAAESLWQRWPAMAVNLMGNHFAVPADLVARPSTRLAAGGRAICGALSQARLNRESAAGI